MSANGGMLALFDGVDGTIEAIEALRRSGLKRLTVYSPAPDHNLEHALHPTASPVRLFTLVGGLTGTATGFALPTWTSLDWPLMTGGKPTISLPAWIIIAFELTVLFGALSTVLGLFIVNRWPNRKPLIIYDRSFSADGYGIYLEPPADKAGAARSILRDAGALEVREEVTRVS
jgi:Alternative complex III, ActD subunit